MTKVVAGCGVCVCGGVGVIFEPYAVVVGSFVTVCSSRSVQLDPQCD